MKLGDSLSRRIDEGVARSNYGVVILSENFFQRAGHNMSFPDWPLRQRNARKVMLPVWHNVDHARVLDYSPPRADAMAQETERVFGRLI